MPRSMETRSIQDLGVKITLFDSCRQAAEVTEGAALYSPPSINVTPITYKC